MDKGRGGKERSASRNTKRLSRERLREYLQGTRLIDDLGWIGHAGSLVETIRWARRKVVAACDYSMPRRKHRHVKCKEALRRGINRSRLQCWKDLIDEVEKDSSLS